MKQSKRNNILTTLEVLLFLNVCPQVVLLDESNIALFAFEITFVILSEIPKDIRRKKSRLLSGIA